MSCGKQSNRDFFNEMASTWDAITDVNGDKIRHILDVAGIKRGDRVLDIGTGTGVLIPYIEEIIGHDGAIDAADISEEMLRMAHKKYGGYGNVRFLNIDIESDILYGAYDKITLYCMYPHLERPMETLRWLVRLNLIPGGRLIIAFPENRNAINGIHRHNDSSVHYDRLAEAKEMASRLEAAGLDVLKYEDSDEFYIIVIEKKH